MQLGSWLSSLWHSAGPEIAAAAAIATGNPELAVPAFTAASAASAKKPSAPPPPPPAPSPTAGIAAAYNNLSQADKEVVVVGGAVVGSILLYKLLFGHRGSSAPAPHA